MPDRTLPDILMPGNGGSASPRPWGNGAGSNSQTNSPISPIEGYSPFERAPPGGTPLANAAPAPPAPTYQPDSRVGRNPPEPEGQEFDEQRDISAPRERSRPNRRICKKCGEPLTGQFVRALNGTFHLECFKCHVSAHCRLGFIGFNC